MNKKDAKVFKALAECGFEVGKEIPDPELDRILDIITDPEKLFLEDVFQLHTLDEEDVTNAIEAVRWEDIHVGRKPEEEKKRIRNKNNDALAQLLDKLNISYKRELVKDILDDDSIPSYEKGVVVDGRHANYHRGGFRGGESGNDTTDEMDLEKAFWFITNNKLKRADIRSRLNDLIKKQ